MSSCTQPAIIPIPTVGKSQAVPVLMDTEAICALLNVSEQTARRMMRNGDIPAVKIGRKWYVKGSDVMALFEGGSNE